MTRPQKPWLDWRAEKVLLADSIRRQGGVVRIQASDSGPLLEFASVLRSHLDHGEWQRPWVTIQFDPENSNTRYFDEMVRQMERSLSIPGELAQPTSLGAGSKLASDLQASAISITNSFNFGHSEYEQNLLQERRADRIAEIVGQRSHEQAVCIMFLQSEGFRRQDLEKFRALLWSDRLERLARDGVLIVDLTRRPGGHGTWPPDVDLHLHLPDQYDSHSRQNAIEDLAELLYKGGREKTEAEALAYSRAMLDSHNTPSTLYAQLAAILATRRSPL